MEKSLEMQLKIANNELKRLKRNSKDVMQIATYNSEKLEPYKIKAEAWDAFFKCNPQAVYDFINSARGDDFLLYYELFKDNSAMQLSIKEFLTMGSFMRGVLSVPNPVSVSRARRMVQEDFPNLKSEKASKARKKEEEEYLKEIREHKEVKVC